MSDSLEEQSLLQKEAEQVADLLQLEAMLSDLGRPIRVGSSAMGLMVRRDIDITVICENLGPETRAAFAQIAARLMVMESHVVSVRFRNDTGRWNKEPASYPDGLYLGLNVRTDEGADWTVDIWAVDQPERQPDLLHLQMLLPRITDEHRQIILTIKRALAARSDKTPSACVYEAVVDEGVRSLDQLELWLSTRKG